jgi:hypothetical protein
MQALLKSVVTSITEVPKLWSMPPRGSRVDLHEIPVQHFSGKTKFNTEEETLYGENLEVI